MLEPRAEMPAMSAYGVERSTWMPLPWAWAAERLATNKNFWVVTVSGQGQPHALPVWGVWDDGEHRFAFSCADNSRKARNLAENSRAVVMTDDTVECLSIEGAAERVDDRGRCELWADRYMAKYRTYSGGLSTDFVLSNAIFEFRPERAIAVIEREAEFATRPTRWVF